MKLIFVLAIMFIAYLRIPIGPEQHHVLSKEENYRRFQVLKSIHARNISISFTALLTVKGTVGLLLFATILFALYVGVPKLVEQDRKISKQITASELAKVTEQVVMCLSVGMTTHQSLKYVSDSRDSNATVSLGSAVVAMDLGQPLPIALDGLINEDARWQPILDILINGYNSGGQLTPSLDALLLQLRDEAQGEKTRKIRGVAVRCVLPLGLCFLPAFIALTIVPIVASFVAQLSW